MGHNCKEDVSCIPGPPGVDTLQQEGDLMKSDLFTLTIMAGLGIAALAQAQDEAKPVSSTQSYYCYGYISDRTNEGFVNINEQIVELPRGPQTSEVVLGENLGIRLVLLRNETELALSAQRPVENGVVSLGSVAVETDAKKLLYFDLNESSILSAICEVASAKDLQRLRPRQ